MLGQRIAEIEEALASLRAIAQNPLKPSFDNAANLAFKILTNPATFGEKPTFFQTLCSELLDVYISRAHAAFVFKSNEREKA